MTLTLNGAPFRFVGQNSYRLASLPGGYTCGGELSSADLGTLLDQAKAAGATVVRTWFFQSYYQGSGRTWTALDRVLDAAATRGLKVIPVLTNQWPDCEFTAKDDAFYTTGYRQAGYGYDLSFRDWARTVATRYAGRSTIAFWQLVNEAETRSDCYTGQALRAFADDMAGVLKAADPNHLVSLGTLGSGQCGATGDTYQYVHAGAIDLCEVHDYGAPSVAIPGDQWNGMQRRIDQCAALGKPFFVGESGILANVGSGDGLVSPTTLAQRAAYFAAKMTAAFAAGVDGYVLWERMLPDRATMHGFGPADFGVGLNDPTDAKTLLQAQGL